MIERPDAHFELMESVLKGAVPDIILRNTQDQKKASRMLSENHPHAPEYLDLSLTPDFMRDNSGSLLVEARDQRLVAEEVLNGLHEKWHGTRAIEHQVSDKILENIWFFVDKNFIHWTVIEVHNLKPKSQEVGIAAYIEVGTKRPTAIRELDRQPRWSIGESNTSGRQQKRTHRLANALMNIITKPGSTHRSNRWI